MDYIHHLLGFSAGYILANEKAKEIKDKRDKEDWKEFRESELWNSYTEHAVYMGTYTDKQKLIDRVLSSKNMWDIHEGWYDYLLIESYEANHLEGAIFDAPDFNESEMWFKFVKLGEDQYEYQQIPRPECLKGVCNFL